jgi:hypothetical protein
LELVRWHFIQNSPRVRPCVGATASPLGDYRTSNSKENAFKPKAVKNRRPCRRASRNPNKHWLNQHLRVPFSYRTLQDATGTWKRDAKCNIDFSRMDWIVKEAQARGMYVVFVLHTWPGDYHDTSRNTPTVARQARDDVARTYWCQAIAKASASSFRLSPGATIDLSRASLRMTV